MIEDLKHKFENYKPYINGYKNMKRSSVLIPIVKKDNMHYILFQVRSKNLKSQPNEISFPGGKIENNESPLDAVIRETCEELGTNVKNVNIISPIDLLITPGNMIIHPFVGYINNIDSLHINKDEVDHILTTFLNRGYEPNGAGGLFTVNNTSKDMRDIEIWYQMCLFFDDLL